MSDDRHITVPRGPLYAWAEDEALLAEISRAMKARDDADYHYRRAPRGKKQKALKALQKAAHRCLELELKLKGKR